MCPVVDLAQEIRKARASLTGRPSLRRVVVQALVSMEAYNKRTAAMVGRLNNHLPLGSTLDGQALHHLTRILEEHNAT